MGGMGSSALYERARFGTKNLIEAYVDEIVDGLDYLSTLENPDISEREKLDFFYRANHCYGRSALLLSGGGTLGLYHLGVVKALHEHDLLPRVISGASAGSIVAGVVGTRTDEELQDFFANVRGPTVDPGDPETVADAAAGSGFLEALFVGESGPLDVDAVRETIAKLIPNMTFQEAYDETGRQISISVAPAEPHQTSRLLNAITSPNVFVRSAVMASCAVPGVYPSVVLEAKNAHGETQPYLPSRKWVDGSISDDLPAQRLARLYGTNHTIVSLVNPIVLPFVRELASRGPFRAGLNRLGAEISRETLSYQRQLVQRYARVPSLNMAVNGLYSLLNQTYSGDITILPKFRRYNPFKWLSPPSGEELAFLIREGERSTWEEISAIETSTKISRRLDRILEGYERANPKAVRAARRRPRTPKSAKAPKSAAASKSSKSSDVAKSGGKRGKGNSRAVA